MQILTRNNLQEILSDVELMHVELTCNECLSNKEKADRLNRSIDTINSHMKNIFKKLNINKVTELSKIYFTAFVLVAIFSLHGVFDTQIRSRVRLTERRTVSLNQRSLRSRRRERSVPINNIYNQNNISV